MYNNLLFVVYCVVFRTTNMIKLVHWLPRIICILAILFISIFALDAFEPGLTLWQQIGGFLIHLIPSFVLIIILLVAWRWELTGGMILIVLAVGLMPFIYSGNYANNHSVWISLSIILSINFPFALAGVLFILSYYLKKKNPNLR